MSDPMNLINEARLVELLKTMVKIRSITNQEHEISDWTYDFFQSLGLSGVQRLSVEESGDTIVGWIEGASTGPTMLLNFHLDTFAAFEGWETDPFDPVIKAGKMYGVGVHDMKAGGACILGTVEALLQSEVELGGKILIAATTDEENWSRGAHEVINHGFLKDCKYCLIPEPTAPGALVIGRRGRHVFHLKFMGKTVHAAYEGGINAVVDAAKAVDLLSHPGTIDLGYNQDFGLGGSFCVIGFHGGGTLILVPEEAHVYIDRHILPGQTVEQAAEQIRVVLERAELTSKYELTWDERPVPAPPSYLVPPDSHFVQTVSKNMVQEFNQEIKHVLGKSVADTNHFAVHGNVSTLTFGPRGGNTCEANEYVEIASLAPVARAHLQSVLDLLGSPS